VIRLTRRRLEQARQIRQEWRRHALSTAPADRPAAEEAVRRLYKLDGRPAPRFVWADSPLGALLAIWGLSDDHREAQGAGLLADVRRRRPLPSAAWRYELTLRRRHPLTARFRRGGGDLGPVLSSPPPRVGPLNRDRLLLSPDDRGLPPFGPVLVPELRARVAPELRRLVFDFADKCTTGQFDAQGVGSDLVYCDLGVVTLRPDYAERLDLLAALARCTGPWWPYPDVCVMTERPVRFEIQPQSSGSERSWLVLHSLDGPALAWRDGFAIHAWHGAQVPERYNTGEATAEDWLDEENAEFRRLIAERMGYAWLLDQMDAQKIASDEYGTLWRIPSRRGRGEEDVVLVDVVNSTVEPDGSQRRYVLRVPPDQRVPRDAIGWTFGLAPGSYQPAEMT
jgi:hypothetical protein